MKSYTLTYFSADQQSREEIELVEEPKQVIVTVMEPMQVTSTVMQPRQVTNTVMENRQVTTTVMEPQQKVLLPHIPPLTMHPSPRQTYVIIRAHVSSAGSSDSHPHTQLRACTNK